MHDIFVRAQRAYARVRPWVLAHRALSVGGALVVLILAYAAVKSLTSTTGEMTYTLGLVTRGTVVSTVTESGQVSASQQLNLSAQVSGQVVYVGAKPGQTVTAGTLLIEVDPTTAYKAIRDAEINLQSATLSLQKLEQPATTLSLTQAHNALSIAQTSQATTLTTAATDITGVVLDLPNTITGIQDILTGMNIVRNEWNMDYYNDVISRTDSRGQSFRDEAYTSFLAAQKSFNATLADYKSADLTDVAQVTRTLDEVYATAQTVADSVRKANALVQFYEDTLKTQNLTPNPVADTQLTSFGSYTTTVNNHLVTLLNDKNAIVANAQSVTEKQQSLAETESGADPLDLQSAKLSVTKAQNALDDAKANLANYFIRAPFDGVVGSLAVNKYDYVSGTIGTLITNQQYADLSVNEVDAAKISVGNKATVTFSALPSLTLTGTVLQKNAVGTVSQGVVTYDVKLALDAQNPQVQPGMSLTAKLITKTAVDTLVVPSSAVKTQAGQHYVLQFSSVPQSASSTDASSVTTRATPTKTTVTVGISDSANTEILSGLREGEQVVVKSAAATAAAPAAQTTSSTNRSGSFGGGGGGVLRGL